MEKSSSSEDVSHSSQSRNSMSFTERDLLLRSSESTGSYPESSYFSLLPANMFLNPSVYA